MGGSARSVDVVMGSPVPLRQQPPVRPHGYVAFIQGGNWTLNALLELDDVDLSHTIALRAVSQPSGVVRDQATLTGSAASFVNCATHSASDR
jgi:hypothetical protein